jgi:hypothetical protein
MSLGGYVSHFTECENRDGFHASFSRASPAPITNRKNGEDAILLSGSFSRVIQSESCCSEESRIRFGFRITYDCSCEDRTELVCTARFAELLCAIAAFVYRPVPGN